MNYSQGGMLPEGVISWEPDPVETIVPMKGEAVMASMPKFNLKFKVTGLKGTRYFYARPCDEPRKGWCVAEVEFSIKGAKWSSTLYEPVMIRLKAGDDSISLTGMTKQQAKREAMEWNAEKSNPKGIRIVRKR